MDATTSYRTEDGGWVAAVTDANIMGSGRDTCGGDGLGNARLLAVEA